MKYSFIIPVFNAEKTIVRTVDSIEKNSFKDFEIILIDDCSRDSSLEVCHQLKMNYSNIKVLNNERNSGVSFTRNRGLEAAEGEYILFCDSDDWVEPDYIESFNQYLKIENNNLLLICGYWNHDELVSGRLDEVLWSSGIDYVDLYVRQDLKNVYDKGLLQQLWNKCFNKELIESNKIRFDESISIGEDTRFLLDYIQKAHISSLGLLNRPLYHYMRDRSGSLMYRVGYESVEEPLKNLRVLYEVMKIDSKEIERRISEDRKRQQEMYAYLINHNLGMKKREKFRLTLKLDSDPKRGWELWTRNEILGWKEKVFGLIFRKRRH